MPQVQLNDVVIHYEQAGETGPTLVLLHGMGSNSRSWRYQLRDLSDEFRVIAWDAPGYGGSSDPDFPDEEEFRMSHFADYLAAFLDKLGLEQVDLLGLSMGGIIAQAFYARYSSRVRSLILADTNRGSASRPMAERLEQLNNRLRAAQNPADLARRRGAALLSPAAEPTLIAEVTAIMGEIHPAGYRLAAYAMAHADYTDLLPRIKSRVLILCGEQDSVTPPHQSELLQKQIPGAKLLLIPQAGHASNQEQPAAFSQAVRQFLKTDF